MAKTPNIWGLVDDRAGHSTQTVGLLEHLGVPYSKKTMHYNALAALPNLFNPSGLAHLTKESLEEIAPPYPDMVVAAGRRLAPVLRAIKRASPDTITIYLMWPDKINGLDLIIAPRHDNPPPYKNVIETSAPLTAITEKGLNAARVTFTQHVAHLPKPWIAVCLGAPIKGMEYTLDDWRSMIAKCQRLARKGALLITTSRRTPLEVEEMLEREITGPSYLHFYHAGSSYNPYTGFLACADAICVSGDSLSMCAEAVATGKPLFIHAPEHATAYKHLAQHQVFYDNKLAMPLDARARVGWQPEAGARDMEKVVAEIKRRFSHLFSTK